MNAQKMTLSDRNALTINYQDLMMYLTYVDRLNYLSLSNFIYQPPKHISESFYNSHTWRKLRRDIIARDLGYDLAIGGLNIYDKVLVHHIKPVLEEDLINYNEEILLNPNNLITVSLDTHNKIHYSSKTIETCYEERQPGDTKLW